jgi:hypothetical protein
MGPMSELENRPITKSFLLGKMVQNQKIVFFYAVYGHWAPPNEPETIHNGPQVGGMYGLKINQ